MSGMFAFAYLAAGVATLAEGLLLREALRRTVWLQQLYMDSEQPDQQWRLPPGAPAPEFSVPVLGPGKRLRTADLRGQSTVLFFVVPEQAASSSYDTLLAALHAWWHRTKGFVFLVCTGTNEKCRQLALDRASGFPAENVMCDEAGVLARAFRIGSTPQAVELDPDANVKRYGRPETVEPPAAEEEGQDANVQSKMDVRFTWPDERPMSGAGFARVETTISCVLSRFRLKSPLYLVPFYLAFRRVRREARRIRGLMQAVFLLEDFRTCYTLSFWRDDWSIVEFGRVRAHVEAANSAFNATYRKDLKRAEIWSAQFRLWAVSCHNSSWEGLDLQAALGDQWLRRQKVAAMAGSWEEIGIG